MSTIVSKVLTIQLCEKTESEHVLLVSAKLIQLTTQNNWSRDTHTWYNRLCMQTMSM